MKKCKICDEEIVYNGCKYIHARMVHSTMVIEKWHKHEAIFDVESKVKVE